MGLSAVLVMLIGETEQTASPAVWARAKKPAAQPVSAVLNTNVLRPGCPAAVQRRVDPDAKPVGRERRHLHAIHVGGTDYVVAHVFQRNAEG